MQLRAITCSDVQLHAKTCKRMLTCNDLQKHAKTVDLQSLAKTVDMQSLAIMQYEKIHNVISRLAMECKDGVT